MLTKWLGVIEAAVVFGGLTGLVAGIYLLAKGPLPGVMLMLASTALLVSSAGKLAAAQEVRQESGTVRERYSRRSARNSAR